LRIWGASLPSISNRSNVCEIIECLLARLAIAAVDHAPSFLSSCRPLSAPPHPSLPCTFYFFLHLYLDLRRNAENRFTGWTDVPLSATGEGEARAAGATLRAAGFASFDLCFTSVLTRAIKTAWLVLEALGVA
jgi:2,3-bisphosphoglycerate-dependent phosphoglycerate mutase